MNNDPILSILSISFFVSTTSIRTFVILNKQLQQQTTVYQVKSQECVLSKSYDKSLIDTHFDYNKNHKEYIQKCKIIEKTLVIKWHTKVLYCGYCLDH